MDAVESARQKVLDIGQRLEKRAKEFTLDLVCPDCGGTVENFSCRACAGKNDTRRGGLFAAGAGYAFVVIMSWLMPLIAAGVGYVITMPDRKGLIIGFFAGAALAASGRKMERANYDRARSGTASDLVLAERFQQKTDSYDMAAFCYLHWLAKWENFDAAKNLPMFLWRYRHFDRGNAELRRLLLDRLFYKACPGTLNTSATANLIIAVANDSSEQVATAVALREWNTAIQFSNSGLLRLSELLSFNAPLVASAFEGKATVEPNKASTNTTVWYFAGAAWTGWPKVDLGSVVASAKEESLRFVYINLAYSHRTRLVGITNRNIMVWREVAKSYTNSHNIKPVFSEPLASIEGVCEELSHNGRTRRGTWLLAREHTYCFDGASEFAMTLDAIHALPDGLRPTQVRSPRDSQLLFWGRLGLTLSAIAAVAMIVVVVRHPSEKGDFWGAIFGSLFVSGFFGAVPLKFLLEGLGGTRKAFRSECGLTGVPNFADPIDQQPVSTL